MGHEGHHHEEKQPLTFFASPLVGHSAHGHTAVHQDEKQASLSDADIEQQHPKSHHDPSQPNFENMDCALHDSPAFHRHAEATTAELFYDLFFVANLTTFTSLKEINNYSSLTSYIGFFSLLWLTWYQVSLYDVRFSSDSVFERVAKGIHFGVMVGFAVMGAQWEPGSDSADYKIYKCFGFILMASRLTLFAQYGVTLFYTKKFPKTVVPLAAVMAFTLASAIVYGGTTAAFPTNKFDADGFRLPQASNVYIAWYVVGISETILTVAVSCIWRIVSFKGTHMVQRMSLLTLIILGEGIIVICKSISKIVKNDYLWTAAVVGQIVAAVLIIYFLYMLYFDWIQEEHFGSIRQQIWSFLHFPLHTSLVLILQGVSLLIIWCQALSAMNNLDSDWTPGINWAIDPSTQIDNTTWFSTEYLSQVPGTYETNGSAVAAYFWNVSFYHVYVSLKQGSKGIDTSTEQLAVWDAKDLLGESIDFFQADPNNATAADDILTQLNVITSATLKTLFDTFSVNVPKDKNKDKKQTADVATTVYKYYKVFDLVMSYAFIAGGLSLILTTILGVLSLPARERRLSVYIRLGINGGCGLALCLVSLIRFDAENMYNFLGSAWMIPTICLTLFICVVSNHIRLPKRKSH